MSETMLQAQALIYNGERAMELASSPPPDAVVAGLLHRGHITVLSAPPYSGKSWFSLNIASAVASVDEVKTPAPWPGAVLECAGTNVVYLSPDFPASELARRLKKLDNMRSDLVRKDSYWDNSCRDARSSPSQGNLWIRPRRNNAYMDEVMPILAAWQLSHAFRVLA